MSAVLNSTLHELPESSVSLLLPEFSSLICILWVCPIYNRLNQASPIRLHYFPLAHTFPPQPLQQVQSPHPQASAKTSESPELHQAKANTFSTGLQPHLTAQGIGILLSDEFLRTSTHCSILNELETSTQLFINWAAFKPLKCLQKTKGWPTSPTVLVHICSVCCWKLRGKHQQLDQSLADARFKESCSNLWVPTKDPEQSKNLQWSNHTTRTVLNSLRLI